MNAHLSRDYLKSKFLIDIAKQLTIMKKYFSFEQKIVYMT